MWHRLPDDVVRRIVPFAWPTLPCKAELRAAHAVARCLAQQVSLAPSDADVHFFEDAGEPPASILFLKARLRARGIHMTETVDPDTGEEFTYYYNIDVPATTSATAAAVEAEAAVEAAVEAVEALAI